MSSTLLSIFSEVSDPRRGQGKMYPLAPILLFTVLATLSHPDCRCALTLIVARHRPQRALQIRYG